LGAERKEQDLLEAAERAAAECKDLVGLLTGHPPWGAQADAALARVWLARGRDDQAVDAARSAYAALESALHEDAHLDVVIPVAEAMIAAGSEEEAAGIRAFIQITVAMVAQRTADEDVRSRWLRGPLGRELVRLSGSLEGLTTQPGQTELGESMDDTDVELLRRLVEGLTNREIAARLGLEEEFVTRRLGEIFASMGASSRAQAKAFALMEQVV
jgi:DNA-binding NarL/FixJ family response regulator